MILSYLILKKKHKNKSYISINKQISQYSLIQMSQAKISGPILQTTGPNEPETIILIFFYVHVLETVMQCKPFGGI